jgi:hypothetical protein
LHVEEHGVGAIRSHRGQGFRRVRGFAADNVAGALQELPSDSAERLMIVDDQHTLSHT